MLRFCINMYRLPVALFAYLSVFMYELGSMVRKFRIVWFLCDSKAVNQRNSTRKLEFISYQFKISYDRLGNQKKNQIEWME